MDKPVDGAEALARMTPRQIEALSVAYNGRIPTYLPGKDAMGRHRRVSILTMRSMIDLGVASDAIDRCLTPLGYAARTALETRNG